MSDLSAPPSLEYLDRRVAEIAGLISQIETENRREAAIFSHLLAACYALRSAIAYEAAEVTAPLPEDGDAALRLVAGAIAAGESPHESWLAGFHLNAAEDRLAAAETRLKRYRDITRDDFPPKPRRFGLATRRTRAEEIAIAVARLEDVARRVIPE